MRTLAVLIAACGVGTTLLACACVASELAVPLIARERPILVVAQRAIDREWGPSDDSVYVEVDVPQWRSETGAAALSAVVPGAGQIYAGQERRGLVMLVAEIGGWTARQVWRHRGRALRTDARAYAGSPLDASSRWSFQRWTAATHQDPSELSALYYGDREAFDQKIANDPLYRSGWASEDARSEFGGLRRTSDARYRNARYTSAALWIHHLLSAFDALQIARLHNLPLGRDVGLGVRTGWDHGDPALVASLEARF
jgi:hypothetical protein